MPNPVPGPVVEPLMNTSEGDLRIGPDDRAYRASEAPDLTRPSISGPSDPRAYGLGGSVVGSDASSVGGLGFPSVRAQSQQGLTTRSYTPEELAAWADQQRDQYLEGTRQASVNPSSVQGALDRTNGGVPDWLVQYMEKKPVGGELQVDRLGHQKYKFERDLLRKLKSKS